MAPLAKTDCLAGCSWRACLIKAGRTSNRMGVTLRDVAEYAGVSTAAASKALNGRPDVSPHTRMRIINSVKELGYRPKEARGMISGGIITVVFDTLESAYALRVLAGATRAAQSLGVHLHIMAEDFPLKAHKLFELDWFKSLAASGSRGVIVVTSGLTQKQADAATQCGIPLVMVDPARATPRGVSSIGATNWEGGLQATSYLIKIGHRRIGFLSGLESSVPNQERLQGYRSALDAAGIDFDPILVAGSGFRYEDGLAGANQLLTMENRPTAIFAACDATASAVLEVARKLGLAVPNDLSVIGFDDTELATHSTPPLTTVHQSLDTMGASAVQACFDQSEHRNEVIPRVQLQVHLVERDSTGAPPKLDSSSL